MKKLFIPMGYTVTVEHKGEKILNKKFISLVGAQIWACKKVNEILVCDCPATIVSNTTGEIKNIISR